MNAKLGIVFALILAFSVAFACGSPATKTVTKYVSDDDASPTDDDGSPADDDNTPAAWTCQTVFDEFYKVCDFHLSVSTGPMPESQVVAACEKADYCLGFNEPIAQCIRANAPDCEKIKNCVMQYLPCSEPDDDASPID